MARFHSGAVASQIVCLMIGGELPIDLAVFRSCCCKLTGVQPRMDPAVAVAQLIEAVELLDTGVQFNVQRCDLAKLRSAAHAALEACSSRGD